MLLVDRAVRPYPSRSDRPLVYAHRGASANAPENTLEAFILAAQEGADGVELDAMVCGSGEVVVCHDPWLDRLAGRQLCVNAAPLSALREVDVARHFPSWGRPARIPTLDEVLEAVPGLLVNIELKEERWADQGLAKKVAEIVARHGAEHRVTLSSFNALELARARIHAPLLPAGYLFEREQPFWARTSLPAPLTLAQAVHPEDVLVTPSRVRAWHAAGFRVATWTVDDPPRARQLAQAGVDAVITNRPRRILDALSLAAPVNG